VGHVRPVPVRVDREPSGGLRCAAAGHEGLVPGHLLPVGWCGGVRELHPQPRELRGGRDLHVVRPQLAGSLVHVPRQRAGPLIPRAVVIA